MLEHLRQRVTQTLANARQITISTSGPAGLQASRVACEALGLSLFILIPRTSDHLFNLESNPDVVVVNESWDLRGVARKVLSEAAPPGLQIARASEAQWSALIEIQPRRVHFLHAAPSGHSETIDVD